MIDYERLTFQEKRSLIEQKIFGNTLAAQENFGGHAYSPRPKLNIINEEVKNKINNTDFDTTGNFVPTRQKIRLSVSLNAVGLDASENSLKRRLAKFGVSIDRIFSRDKFCIHSDKGNDFGDQTWRLIFEILCIKRSVHWIYEGSGGSSFTNFTSLLHAATWSIIDVHLKLSSHFLYKSVDSLEPYELTTRVKSFKICVTNPQDPTKGLYEAVSKLLYSSPQATCMEIVCDNRHLDISQFVFQDNLRNIQTLTLYWIVLDALQLIRLCKMLPLFTNLNNCCIINARFVDDTFGRIFSAISCHPKITSATLLSGLWNSELLPVINGDMITDLIGSNLTCFKTWPVKMDDMLVRQMADNIGGSKLRVLELRRLRGVSPIACQKLKDCAALHDIQLTAELY